MTVTGAYWIRVSTTYLRLLRYIERAVLNKRISQDEVDTLNLDALEHIMRWISTNKSTTKYRVSGNKVTMYANDIKLLQDFYYVPKVSITEAIVGDIGFMYFRKEPKFKYRVYLTNGKHINFNKELREFLARYANSTVKLGVSNSLKRHISAMINYNYIYETYYIEYNEESTFGLLALTFGEMLGKRYELALQPKV